jgi:hypothetical protein
MSLTHKSSERVMPRGPSSLGTDNVVAFDRVFAVKGPDFHDRFLAQMILPVRQDVAVMALQQVLAKRLDEGEANIPECVDIAFKIADQFCLASTRHLDARLPDYFKLYMERGDLSDIIRSQMDASHDWSL